MLRKKSRDNTAPFHVELDASSSAHERAAGPRELLELLREKQQVTHRVLAQRWEIPLLKVKDPERMKGYSRIAARLAELELSVGRKHAEGPYEAARSLLTRIEPGLSREASWDVSEQLKLMTLYFASDERLSSLLEGERKLEQTGSEDVLPYGSSQLWGARFDQEELGQLCAAFRDANGVGVPVTANRRALAMDRLALLYEARIDAWRHTRATTQLRANYLMAVVFLLGVLLVAVALSFGRTAATELLLAAMATGALGSTLTGVFKLRNEVLSISKLRSYSPVLLALPVVGATAATLLFVILRTGFVSFGALGPDELRREHFALFGFLAGFSETFFLGIVKRLASTVQEESPVASSLVVVAGDEATNPKPA